MDKEIKERIAAINSGIIPEGYKKTKVGIVPMEWEVERFDKIATKFDYGLNAAAKSFDGENKYIRITDIDEGSNKYSLSDVVSPDCELDEDYLVEENDILFARTGASTGKTYLYNINDGKMFFAGFLIRANINIENNAYFIFSQTLTERYSNWVRIFSMRSGQPGINAQEYKAFEVILPPLPEQQKIAEILSTQDKLIELQENKIEQLKELKKAYLQKMFPKKGSKYPELRFKGFTDPWEQREFSKFTFPTGEKNKNDLPLEPYAITNEHGFIAQSEAHDDFGYMQNVDRTMYIIVKPNSFAYNPARINVGSLGYYEGTENVIVSSLYEVFQTADYVDDVFLNYWFKTKNFMDWIAKLQEGSVRQYFYYDKLCECKMSMPSVAEQQQIGSYFRNLDNLITLHQRKSEQEKQKKKALMQLLLTGIVRTK